MTLVRDLRQVDDPTPLDRALLDEALRSDPPPVAQIGRLYAEIERIYRVGSWGQMRMHGLGVPRDR